MRAGEDEGRAQLGGLERVIGLDERGRLHRGGLRHRQVLLGGL